jgi:hypothetical protein
MQELSFEGLLEAVLKLDSQQKRVLVQAIGRLEFEPSALELDSTESLYGKYAYPPLEISPEALLEEIRLSANAWEAEIDEFHKH